jgi:hypothetical protein
MLCLVAALALAGEARAAETTVEGKHVVVRSTVEHRPTLERCRDVLEAAIGVYEKHLPGYTLPADAKLVLHLYATKEEYAEAITAIGGESFVQNQAFTSNATRECYVVLQPRADPAYLELVGNLPELTAYVVCHEGVHQWLRRCGAPNVSHWPFWYREGMAEYLAEKCLETATPLMEFEDAQERVGEALATGTMLALPRLLHADARTDKSSSLYDHSYTLYRFLAQDTERLARLHDEIRRLGGPGGDFPEYQHALACARALTEVYGPLDALEKKWRDSVKKLTPRWLEHRRSAQVVKDETICASFSGSNSILIAAKPVSASELTLTGELDILGLGEKQAEIYLGYERRDDPRFLKIALGADGYVTLLAFSDGAWRPHLKKNENLAADAIPVGQWIPIRITVRRGTIHVEVRGKEVFAADVPPGFDPLHNRWGVGALGDVVRYRKIAAKETP